MKKINVIVKENTVLELAEDGYKGDIIDLQDLVEVDMSYINNLIASGKDKVYKEKLAAAKTLMESEHQVEVNKLLNSIELLKNEHAALLKQNNMEVAKKYEEQINTLKTEIQVLTKNKYSEIDALRTKNELSINEVKQTELAKYKELEEKYNLLLATLDSKVKQTELGLINKYQAEINKLVSEKEVLTQEQQSIVEKLKSDFELEKVNLLAVQKEEFDSEIKKREDEIAYLKLIKSKANSKHAGEEFEAACNTEAISYMQNGLLNCTWIKDNKVVASDEETGTGTKADYIFSIYADENHNPDELLASVCLEMKNEIFCSTTKRTNASHFKKLHEDRVKKGCEYAVLVSNLEMDKIDLPIYKVQEYKNMYVVRPQYMMVLLNMIASLSKRFSTMLLNQKSEQLELVEKMALLDEFEKIKAKYLDKPLESLEKEIDDIIKENQSIRKASDSIERLCEKIKTNYIEKITRKISDFELQLNKKIVKKMD